MKYLFIVFLLLNVFYLGYELDRETRMHISARTAPAVNKANELELLTQAQRKTLQRQTHVVESDELATEPAHSEHRVVDETVGDEGIQALMTPDIAIEASDSNSKLLQMLDIEPNLKVSAPMNASTIPRCLSYGPFDEPDRARELLDWLLVNRVLHVERWSYEGDKQLFWVYLAPVAERSEALATLEQLQNQGVEDFRLIRKGSFKNAISLGLFSSQARVNRRLSDLNSKGYQPVVVPYGNEDSKKILWVDIQIAENLLLQGRNQGFLATLNATDIDCSEIDMAAAKP